MIAVLQFIKYEIEESYMEDVDIIDLFWVRDEKGIELVDKKYHSVCYSIAWRILTNREDSE